MLSWIFHMVKGILELQQLGLFHPNLILRNTVKIETGSENSVFKIIDFDYAFKVMKREDEPRGGILFKATRAIIVFWLEHPKTVDFLFIHLFKEYDKISKRAALTDRINQKIGGEQGGESREHNGGYAGVQFEIPPGAAPEEY
jgi:hypothetical protein